MKTSVVIATTLIATLVSGCASMPVHYYSLAAAPPELATGNIASCCRIVISSITLPPAVDRAEIVVRRSDDQMLVLSNDVWIAPLRDEVRAALTDNIHRSLATLKGYEWVAQDGPPTIRIDVERFESEPSQFALVQIGWSVTIPGGSHDLTVTCETLNRVSVGDGVSALVHGYQKALSAIGAQIATGIRNLKAVGEDHCGMG